MSEPQRKSFPGTTEGQEPGEGISSPETVVPGTLPPTSAGAQTAQQADPAGYPHEPADDVTPDDRR